MLYDVKTAISAAIHIIIRIISEKESFINIQKGCTAMEKSLNEETYEKLKYDIMNFKLLPGDSISAQKIALRYDVSRTPAREAIVNLEKRDF